MVPSGSVIIHTGAHAVLSRPEAGGRLLAVGVVGVTGSFAPGQAVLIFVRRPLERKDHHQPLGFGDQKLGSISGGAGLLAFKDVIDVGSQGASAGTPSSPDLIPSTASTIGSISTMDLPSRSVSHSSIDSETVDVEATPMASTLTLEPDTHDHNEGSARQTSSRKATGDSGGGGRKPQVHADVKPDDKWVDVKVGRGLAHYNSADITKVMGMKR